MKLLSQAWKTSPSNWVSRRQAGALLFCGLIAVLGVEEGYAQAIHAGVASTSGGGSARITTVTLNNTSGVSETSMWTKFFGLGFPDSDLTGCPLIGGQPTYPVFTIGGKIMPYSMSVAPTYHPSGRLRHAMFWVLLGGNFTIKSGGNEALLVYQSSNTSLPTPSGRSSSDFTAANITHLVTFLDNGSGNYVASLNDAISSAFSDNYVWADGPAGKVFRLRGDYKKVGVAEGNLTNYFYCASLADASGNFGGMKVLPCMATPWGDASPGLRDFKSFSAMALKTGAIMIRDNVSYGRSNTGSFAVSGAGTTFNSPNNVIESGQLARFSGGSLPPGVNSNTSYWLRTPQAGGIYAPPYATFTASSVCSLSSSLVNLTGSGSGTFTCYPFINTYSRLYMCATNGEWDYVQGGGSVEGVSTYVDTNIQVTFDMEYWMKTLLIPAYDLTPTLTSAPASSFYINSCGGTTNYPDQGGGGGWVGCLMSQGVSYIYNQGLSDQINILTLGLVSGQIGTTVRVLGNRGTIPTWNNGHNGSGTPYSGMGALLYHQTYDTNDSYFSVFAPTNQPASYANLLGCSGADFSHKPNYNYLPYLMTGRPEFLEHMIEQASMGVAGLSAVGLATVVINSANYGPLGTAADPAAGSRNVTLGSTHYYGVKAIFQNQQRATAWLLREIFQVRNIIPQGYPECPAYHTYLNDLANDNLAFAVGCGTALHAFNTFAATNGYWSINTGTFWDEPWEIGYMQTSLAMEYGLSRNSDALTLMNWNNQKLAFFVNTFGTYVLGAEETLVTGTLTGTGGAGGAVISAAAQTGIDVQACLTWTISGFLMDTAKIGYVPRVNDWWVWPACDIPAQAPITPIPGGFTADQPYYVKTSTLSSGAIYAVTLSTTMGGSVTNPSDSSTFSHTVFASSSTSQPLTRATSSADIPTIVGRAAYLSESRGATLDARAKAIIATTIPAATSRNFGTFCNWCFKQAV